VNDVLIRLGVDDTGIPQPVQRTNAAIMSIGKAGEISARQTAAAMRQLPAQFTDVATQLAGGANPLLVLLQQGGQVKDSFGGLGNTFRALAGAISPVMVGVGALAAGLGAVATAAVMGDRDSKQLRDTIALTGNAAGLTAARLETMAEMTAEASRQTVGASRDIVLGLARTGQVSSEVLASTAAAVARVADVSGEDSKKVVADFAGMSGGVAKWAAEHNKAWNFITVEQYKYIRRLEEQGQAEKAMIYVNDQITSKLADQKRNLGTLESAWDSIGKTASKAWDAMLNVGREQTTRQQLDIAIARLDALGGNLGPKAKEAAEQRIQLLKEQLKLENQQADARSRNAAAERQAIAAEQKTEGKAPQFPFGAIRDARAQYRQDFLSSEKAFYAEDEKLRQKAREDAEKAAGDARAFDAREAERTAREAEQRLGQAQSFIQQLVDANERGTAELIADAQARGDALIAIDRDIARRRVEEMGLTGSARDIAFDEIDRQALVRRRALERDLRASSDQLAEESGRELYSETRSAISAAFRESDDPLKAFGDALANTIYTRATAAIVDALAAAAVGTDGRGGALGALLGYVGSIQGGGMTVDSGGYGITDGTYDLPTRGGMATGTNYVPRDMFLKAHKGEAIVPAKYNPAAGGSGMGGTQITFAPQIRIDSRTDAEQIAGITTAVMRRAQEAMYADLSARGVLR
jgi:phage-related minor tail protein